MKCYMFSTLSHDIEYDKRIQILKNDFNSLTTPFLFSIDFKVS